MQTKQQQIKDALAAKKAQQERDDASKSIAAALKPHQDALEKAIADGFDKLLLHTAEIHEQTRKNRPLREIDAKVTGGVVVLNPQKDVTVKNPVEEVTVKNQVDLTPLRNDLGALVRTIQEASNNVDAEHKAEMALLQDYMKRLLIKQDAELLMALKPLRALSNDPKHPLAVRLSDGEKFYKAVMQAVTQASSNSKLVEDLLQEIATNTENITVNVDNLDVNLEETELLLGREPYHIYAESTVAAATETQLLSHTVATAQADVARFISVEGHSNFVFRLKKNGSTVWKWRNAWTMRGTHAQLAVKGLAGDVFTVTAENLFTQTCEASAALTIYDTTP